MTPTPETAIRSGRRSLRPFAALVAIALAALTLAPTDPANAIGPAQINGTVTSVDTSLPVQGVVVAVYNPTSYYSAITDAAGHYEIDGIDDGTYTLRFNAGSLTTGSLISEWWNDQVLQNHATGITLAAGDSETFDAQLATGGKITGTVTGNDGPGTFAVSAYLQDPGDLSYGQVAYTIAGSDGTYTLRGLAPGSYHINFGDNNQGPSGTKYSLETWNNHFFPAGDIVTITGTETVTGINALLTVPGPVKVIRLAGADRFATSAAVWSDPTEYPDGMGGTVYVANGLSFPDALGAGPAAARSGSPLMLVQKDSIPAAVLTQLERLAPQKIVMVGGPAVLSESLKTQLQALSVDPVERIAGADRYETSRELITAAYDSTQPTSVLLVATGANYPDALSAGPASATQFNSPVLLVPGTASTLDSATSDFIDSLNPGSILIVGGTSAVSSAIETALAGTGHPVTRIAGADRYATSTAINDYFKVSFESSAVYLAVGTGFADALSGAARAAYGVHALYVTPPSCIPLDDMLYMRTYGTRELYLLGGTAALGANVEALHRC